MGFRILMVGGMALLLTGCITTQGNKTSTDQLQIRVRIGGGGGERSADRARCRQCELVKIVGILDADKVVQPFAAEQTA